CAIVILLNMRRHPPVPPLIPYTTLFRSKANFHLAKIARAGLVLPLQKALQRARRENRPIRDRGVRIDPQHGCVNLEVVPLKHLRSEEHTSELQSLAYLVCRLLLEKKNSQ